VFACAAGLTKGDELLLDYGIAYWIRAGHVATHIRHYSLSAALDDDVVTEFFTLWWAANGIGEKADFTYETRATCESLFEHATTLLDRVRELGYLAKRTPLAGMRTEGAVNVVGGGVVGSCDRAPGVLADPHFGDVVLLPLVTATVSNLPAVVYQSSTAYCVLYSFLSWLGAGLAVHTGATSSVRRRIN
jgi:hypothetical protein